MAVGPMHPDRAQEHVAVTTQPCGRRERKGAISGPEHEMRWPPRTQSQCHFLPARPTFPISSIFHWHLVEREETCSCRMPHGTRDRPYDRVIWQGNARVAEAEDPVQSCGGLASGVRRMKPRRWSKGCSQISTVFIFRPKPDTAHCIHNCAHTVMKSQNIYPDLMFLFWTRINLLINLKISVWMYLNALPSVWL